MEIHESKHTVNFNVYLVSVQKLILKMLLCEFGGWGNLMSTLGCSIISTNPEIEVTNSNCIADTFSRPVPCCRSHKTKRFIALQIHT